MKQKKCVFFIVSIVLSLILSIQVYAVGDGNLDGGGGSMGQGTSQNSWSPGNEGVRVTVIRAESHDPVTRPIDLTNKHPNIAYSFGKVSKMSYTRGSALMIDTNPYEYVNPAQSLPRIISSKSLGQANIEQIKSYFTDEQVVRSIAGLTGMDFDTLVGGEYRLLLEPISFLKFQGTLIAVTATEAALYDELPLTIAVASLWALTKRLPAPLSHGSLPKRRTARRTTIGATTTAAARQRRRILPSVWPITRNCLACMSAPGAMNRRSITAITLPSGPLTSAPSRSRPATFPWRLSTLTSGVWWRAAPCGHGANWPI